MSNTAAAAAPQRGSLYADLSGYYDRFCANIDYAEQSAFARRVFAAFASSDGRSCLDLACGSGQHLLDLQRHGFEAHGLDNSAEMLALAAERCPGAELLLCDLAGFDAVARYDLITCFLYSLHYSHPRAALAETLRRSHAALKPGGVLLFNAVDARGIRNIAGITSSVQEGEVELQFRSGWHYAGEGEVLDLHLQITRQGPDGTQQWRDHHIMTALDFPCLQALLQDCGFEVIMLEHDYTTLRPWDGASSNAIFVACKAA
jgi:SAM-dependent methyltransferase